MDNTLEEDRNTVQQPNLLNKD